MENANDPRTLFRSAIKTVIAPRISDLIETAKHLCEKNQLDKNQIGAVLIALAIGHHTFERE